MKLHELTLVVSSPPSVERNPPKQKTSIHSRSYDRGLLRRRIKDFSILTIVVVVLTVTLISFFKITTSPAPDFSVFYYGAKDLILKQNPYQDPKLFTGIGYPPLTLLFFLPLAIMPYQIAQSVWLGLSFLSLLGAVYLSLKISLGHFSRRFFWLVLALVLFAFPTKFTFGMGQSNLVALFLLLLAFSLFKDKKSILAGLILGLVCLIKPILASFLLLFFLKKAWIVVFTAFLMINFFILVSFFIFNPNLYWFYINEIIPQLLNLAGREIYYNQGIMGFISRSVLDLGLRRNLTILFSLAITGMTFWIIKGKGEGKNKFAIFFPAILLLDTLSWQHHFVWLIFPFIAIYSRLLKAKFVPLKLILLLAYILVAINFKDPLLVGKRLHPLFLSHVFLGTIILWGLGIYFFKKDHESI